MKEKKNLKLLLLYSFLGVVILALGSYTTFYYATTKDNFFIYTDISQKAKENIINLEKQGVDTGARGEAIIANGIVTKTICKAVFCFNKSNNDILCNSCG